MKHDKCPFKTLKITTANNTSWHSSGPVHRWPQVPNSATSAQGSQVVGEKITHPTKLSVTHPSSTRLTIITSPITVSKLWLLTSCASQMRCCDHAAPSSVSAAKVSKMGWFNWAKSCCVFSDICISVEKCPTWVHWANNIVLTCWFNWRKTVMYILVLGYMCQIVCWWDFSNQKHHLQKRSIFNLSMKMVKSPRSQGL